MIKAKTIMAAIAASCATMHAVADEGMWTIGNIPQPVYQKMKDLGLELTRKQLYSPTGHSLKNSVVMFGGYCSGVVVSPNGLLMTNHHCGYESINDHSTTEHDYLTNGFAADRREDEIPTPGLYVNFLVRQQDVTKRINKALNKKMSETRRNFVIDSISDVIANEVKAKSPHTFGEVNAYYDGTQFILSVYKSYTDVRLVFAPPSCVGKFGGDTDNWMWPRQTGDFSVFRIYADRNGEPADYSESNIPLATPDYSPVTLKGYAPGDLCMTIGYPGETERYMSSYGINNMKLNGNTCNITVCSHALAIMKSHMDRSTATRLKYDSQYASFANLWKNNIGMNQSIDKLGIIDHKQKLEAMVDSWTRTSKRGRLFSGVIDTLKAVYDRNAELLKADAWFFNAFGVPGMVRVTNRIMHNDFKTDDEQLQKFKENLKKQYENMDTLVEREVLCSVLTDYKAEMEKSGKHYLPDFYATIDTLFNGDIEAYTRDLFSRTALTSYDSAMALVADTTRNIYDDPMAEFNTALLMKAYELRASNYDDEVAKAERLLSEAVRNMNAENKTFYSDANFTMRLSYGTVGGYTTPEGTDYTYFSTPAEYLAKAKTADKNADFKALPDVISVMQSKNFGRYTDPKTGEMQLCFLTNNDITGGNSGSPMFNQRGELIGLAFDGNWEAMSSDILFDSKLQRCIGVDIRYIMYIMEKWGKCTNLIKELERQ